MTVNVKMNKFVTMENASSVLMTIIVQQAINATKMNAKNLVLATLTVENLNIATLIIKFALKLVNQMKIVNLDIGATKHNATNLVIKKTSVWHLGSIATSMI